MAKSSFWLRGAKGKLGGATIYTANGESVMRVVTGKIKNPKTQAQVIQRVIAKCSASQYSALKDICDHSFEGVKPGANSMARFTSLNNRRFRELAAQANMTGAGLGSVFNFLPLGRKKFVPAEVILSEGSLPRVYSAPEASGAHVIANISANTYESVINSLGLQRGDQLTFITVGKNAANDYVLAYARVILDPRESDGTAAPLSTAFVDNGEIVKPSFRNEGNFATLTLASGDLDFTLNADNIAACAVIVSREQNGQYQRSTCVMTVDYDVLGDDAISLGEAVEISLQGTPIYTESARILNNAGVGGPQASSGNEPVAYTVTVNGSPASVINGVVHVTVDSISYLGVTGVTGNSIILNSGDTPGTSPGDQEFEDDMVGGYQLNATTTPITSAYPTPTVWLDDTVLFRIEFDD